MTWTGRTRRRRTDRLDVMEPKRHLHILRVHVVEHEYDTSRGVGKGAVVLGLLDFPEV